MSDKEVKQPTEAESNPSEIRIGDVMLDMDDLKLRTEKTCVRLGYREAQFLHLLFVLDGKIATHETFLGMYGSVERQPRRKAVGRKMHSLRKKLARVTDQVAIEFVRGGGYRVVVKELPKSPVASTT